MRLFLLVILSLLTVVSFAEEKTVQVGKHVTSSTDAVTMILSLLIVLAVVVVSAYILKKFQITAQGGTQRLKVISSLHVGSKERVVIVQVAEKQMVLGVTSHQITLLDTLDETLDITENTPQSMDKSVLSLLKYTIKQKN